MEEEIYQVFAGVYDRMMEEIPYKSWCEYVTELLQEYGVTKGLLLELGCGTGTLTELFAEQGFDMIGVDASEEMLIQAAEKRIQSGNHILYLKQDMREFELYGTVAAAVSLCDTMNYMVKTEDLVQVLKLVNNYLDPGGIFIFDLKTEYYFSEIVKERVFAENEEEFSYIWQNYYDETEKLNQYLLTLFLEGEDGRYDRYDELHEQRAYNLEEIKEAVKEAGMEFLAAFDRNHRPITDKTERIYVIVKELGKRKEANKNE